MRARRSSPSLRPWAPRREVVDRVARGAALRMYHGDELRTHLKRRTEARRERRETE